MNREQCRGCIYFRGLHNTGGGKTSIHACHYLLDKGHAGMRDGDICFSKEVGKRDRRIVRPYDRPTSGKSIYSGYKVRHPETWI